jgi:hypothetical protein
MKGDQPPDGTFLVNSGDRAMVDYGNDLIVPIMLSADLLTATASSAMTLASQVRAPPFPFLPCAQCCLLDRSMESHRV